MDRVSIFQSLYRLPLFPRSWNRSPIFRQLREPETRRNRFALSQLPFLIYIVTRLSFLHVNEAEFTDGYQLLGWNLEHPVRWHPLYPLLVKSLSWAIDPVVAGRLVSVSSGFAAMVVLKKIAGRLFGSQTATLAAWIYVVSPLIFWVNLRVLTESTFQFLFCMSIYALIIYLQEEKQTAAMGFLAFSGLAALTRPEGFILIPVVAYILFRCIRQSQISIPVVAASTIPWALFIVWSFLLPSSDSYSEITKESFLKFDWNHAILRMISYLDVYPYILVYPVFAFALFHWFRTPFDRVWKGALIYVHVSFFLILLIHPSWSTRFLLIPATLLLLDAAGGLAITRRPVQITVLAGCFCLAVIAMDLQKEMFADFKHSAIAVKGKYENRRVFSDEQAKTSYYLGKPVRVYRRQQLRAGDLLVLHSYNTELNAEKKFLDENYRYRAVYSTHAEIVPVLANAALADIAITNSPVAFIQRFQKQRFQSVVLIIEDFNAKPQRR
jgi:hypothetical protein